MSVPKHAKTSITNVDCQTYHGTFRPTWPSMVAGLRADAAQHQPSQQIHQHGLRTYLQEHSIVDHLSSYVKKDNNWACVEFINQELCGQYLGQFIVG